MFKLVMFDLDGTLVDTAPEIADAVNDALRAIGLAPVPESRVSEWIGHGTEELMVEAYAHAAGVSSQAVRSAGVMDTVMAVFTKFYGRRCGTRSRLFPDVAASLVRLRAMRVRLALVTNKEGRFTRRVLEAHRLDTFFDPVVCGDLLEHKKPHPLPAQFCLMRHRIAAGDALFVGDSGIDVATARNAGIRCWAVPYGYNHGRPVADHAPDRVIPSIRAICDAIDTGYAIRAPLSMAHS